MAEISCSTPDAPARSAACLRGRDTGRDRRAAAASGRVAHGRTVGRTARGAGTRPPKPAFLRLLAEEAGPDGMDGPVLDLPPAAAAQPVDRVAARLGLDTLDLDLLVLAALPGEREGLAAIVRNLHPEHRPAVTGGLAASLAEAGLIGALPAGSPAGRREAVRERLTSGVLGRSGLVRLDRAAPFADAAIIPARRCGRPCGARTYGRPGAGRGGCPRNGRARPVGGRRPGAGGCRGVPPPRAGGGGHDLCAAGRRGGPDGGTGRAGREDPLVSSGTRRPRRTRWRLSPCTRWRAA